MSNQNLKQDLPHVTKWQIAYAARQLRQRKSVTLSCLSNEKDLLLAELSSFSNSKPIMTNSINKPNSSEVFVEIIDTF